eukprot:m.79574 g.79574  ORF g.79574 m.79574 type:complete len:75 (+) comp12718_c0_seq2:173-397(+)
MVLSFLAGVVASVGAAFSVKVVCPEEENASKPTLTPANNQRRHRRTLSDLYIPEAKNNTENRMAFLQSFFEPPS